MGLAHRRLQPASPAPVQIAEPGIAEPVGRTGPVLLPQQRQGHIGAAQLAMLPARSCLSTSPAAPARSSMASLVRSRLGEATLDAHLFEWTKQVVFSQLSAQEHEEGIRGAQALSLRPGQDRASVSRARAGWRPTQIGRANVPLRGLNCCSQKNCENIDLRNQHSFGSWRIIKGFCSCWDELMGSTKSL
jgi:hypothetical protein